MYIQIHTCIQVLNVWVHAWRSVEVWLCAFVCMCARLCVSACERSDKCQFWMAHNVYTQIEAYVVRERWLEIAEKTLCARVLQMRKGNPNYSSLLAWVSAPTIYYTCVQHRYRERKRSDRLRVWEREQQWEDNYYSLLWDEISLSLFFFLFIYLSFSVCVWV